MARQLSNTQFDDGFSPQSARDFTIDECVLARGGRVVKMRTRAGALEGFTRSFRTRRPLVTQIARWPVSGHVGRLVSSGHRFSAESFRVHARVLTRVLTCFLISRAFSDAAWAS